MGSTEFLLYYFVCGIGAGIATVFINRRRARATSRCLAPRVPFSRVLLAFAAFFPDARIFIFGILPMRAPVAVLVLRRHRDRFPVHEPSGRASPHLTHLTGLVFGYLYLLVRLGHEPIHDLFPTEIRPDTRSIGMRARHRSPPSPSLAAAALPLRADDPDLLFVRPWMELEPLVRIGPGPVPHPRRRAAEKTLLETGARPRFRDGLRLDASTTTPGDRARKVQESFVLTPRCPDALGQPAPARHGDRGDGPKLLGADLLRAGRRGDAAARRRGTATTADLSTGLGTAPIQAAAPAPRWRPCSPPSGTPSAAAWIPGT